MCVEIYVMVFHCLNTLTKQDLDILKTTSFWKFRKTKLKTNESYEIKNQLIRNYKILLNWILEKIKNIVYHLAFVLFLSYEYLYIILFLFLNDIILFIALSCLDLSEKSKNDSAPWVSFLSQNVPIPNQSNSISDYKY